MVLGSPAIALAGEAGDAKPPSDNQGEKIDTGKSLDATLTTLDGTTLSFPRDLLGKVTVLHFWSLQNPMDIPFLRVLNEQYRNQGLQIVSINVDDNPEEAKAFITAQGLDWPQVVAGKGADAPLFKRFEIPQTPLYWIIGWDGCVIYGKSGRWWGNDCMHRVVSLLEPPRDLPERLAWYRSGGFLERAGLPDSKSLYADYVATSAKLVKTEPRSEEGAALIQGFVASHANSNAAAATILGYMLALENAQDKLRGLFVKQLSSMHAAHPTPVTGGFLRGCANEQADQNAVFHGRFTRMDGTTLTLPDDLQGKVVFLQFWSLEHPPKPLSCDSSDSPALLPYTGLASIPSKNVVVVGVNLDPASNRAAVEAFLKKSRYPDWIHTFNGFGLNDPVARERDILTLPQTIVLKRDGAIVLPPLNSNPTAYAEEVARLLN